MLTEMTHVDIPFRNPIDSPRAAYVALGAMVSLQLADALASSACWSHGGSEDNWQYRPFSHNGAAGAIVGFAAWDLAEHFIAKRIRVRGIIVDAFQAANSAHGLLYTAGHCR